MSISVVIITKDSEDRIEKVIKNGLALGDEVVVVDTGSQDNTIDVASGLGAKVVELEGEFNFSKARNIGTDNAQSDWVLHLDDDEEINPHSRDRLRYRIQNGDFDVFYLSHLTYHENGAFFNERVQPRLFRKNMFSHHGLIYECTYPLRPIGHTDVIILNHQLPLKSGEYTNRINLNDLETKSLLLHEIPDDIDELTTMIHRCYQLANRKTHGVAFHSLADKAFEAYKKGVEICSMHQEMHTAFSEYMYMVYNKDVAHNCLQQLPLDMITNPNLLAWIALSRSDNGNKSEAFQAIEKALEADYCTAYLSIKADMLNYYGQKKEARILARRVRKLLPDKRL